MGQIQGKANFQMLKSTNCQTSCRMLYSPICDFVRQRSENMLNVEVLSVRSLTSCLLDERSRIRSFLEDLDYEDLLES